MEKRFIAFIVASVLIMAGFMLLQSFFAPKQPAKKPVPLAKKEGAAKEEKKPSAEPKPGEKQPDKGGKQPGPEPPEKPALAEIPEPPPERITLGSVNPADPYRMLVTLNNRGAVIERIELASPKYLDLEDRSGYLGHLALENATGGCLINAVGRGTPAALATAPGVKGGLAPGDVLQAINGQATHTPEEVAELLKKTKPKQTIKLKVRRLAQGKPSELEFTATLGRRPLAMMQPELGTARDAREQQPLSMLLTLRSIGPVNADGTTEGATRIKRGEEEIEELPSLFRRCWQTKKIVGPGGEIEGVEFRFPLEEDALALIGQKGRLEIVKRYRLAPIPEDRQHVETHKGYHLEFQIEIENHGASPQQVAYQLRGPTGLPLEGWWYQNKIHPKLGPAAGARDVIWKTTDVGHSLMGCPQIYDNATAKGPKPTPLFTSADPAAKRQLFYAGVDAQYFTTALLPYDQREQAEIFYTYDSAEARPASTSVRKDKAGRRITNVTFELTSSPTKIEPGGAHSQSFLLFAGPKEYELLAEYNLHKAIEYGWFGWVAWPLGQVLHGFHYLAGNYGLAIIMLTVLVRGCLFPIGRKMAKNMQAMQDLAPEIKAIKEKYKDDLAKQGKAQQELFKKNKINPYAGCLPLFLQMPIFIGLYRALSVDIGLRQAELIPGLSWASNLAGPDMLWFWKPYLPDMLGGEFGYLGPYLNVFPLVTAGLFLLQQYLFTPPPTDEQQAMQQKMMYFMTVFMSIMFFKVPAGLCVYFITSSLWGICERTLMMPKKKRPAEGTPAPGETKKLPAKPGSNGAAKNETRPKEETTHDAKRETR